jgi:hypothetical protein
MLQRPVDKDGFAIDEVLTNGAEETTINGNRSMVPHDEILVGWNNHLWHRAIVGVASRHILLYQLASIDVNPSMVDGYVIARAGDDTLDQAMSMIARRDENHHIPTMDGTYFISDFADQDPIAIVESRLHTISCNLDWLKKKQNHAQGDRNQDAHVTQES